MARFRVAHAAPSLLVAAALALALAAPAGAALTPDPAAGWHGRAITQPRHDPPARSATPVAGWSAGTVRLGTGLHRPNGSRRVRELQTRLARLGYRPGPADGIYGPRTRSATTWFQIKHGLPRIGVATWATVRRLRARTAARPAPVQPRPEPVTRITTGASDPASAAAPADDGGFTWWPWILAALAVAIGTGALVARTHPAPPARARPRPRALGYVRTPGGDSYSALEAHLEALERECDRHGLVLEGVITDELDNRRGRQRPGLNHALERLQRDQLDCLVVGRIEQLAERQVDLHDTLERISRHGGVLVVLDTGPRHEPPAQTPRPKQAEHAHA